MAFNDDNNTSSSGERSLVIFTNSRASGEIEGSPTNPQQNLRAARVSLHNPSEFLLRGEGDDAQICASSNFASKSPNKSVNQLKLAATKKSKKGGTLNRRSTTISHKG